MRSKAVLAALLAVPLAGAVAPAAPPASAPLDLHLDVPQDKGPQHVNVLIREFPVGGASGWHVHAGVEIAYLLQGEMSLEQEGKPLRRLKPGESFMVPRGVAHNGANIGKEPARLVITYVIDQNAPVRSPVEPPHRH